MARENKTRFAALGLLAEKPMSGYDIKKNIEDNLGGFWSESYGQIYPVTKSLADEGLATKSVEQAEGKPDRHVYSITKKGLDELKKWLAQPSEIASERNEMLLKVFFGGQMSLEENLSRVRQFRAQKLGEMEKLAKQEASIQQKFKSDPNIEFRLMTVRCGLQVALGYIKWCDGTIETLSRMAKSGEKIASDLKADEARI